MVATYGQGYYDEMQRRCRERQKERYWANLQLSREKSTKYRRDNKEHSLAYGAKWRAKNKDKLCAAARRYYWENREVCLARGREWKKKNPERTAHHYSVKTAKRKGAVGSHTAKEWREILDAYGNKCAYCKRRDKITKDHKVPLARGGSNYALNLQPLCHSCNMHKQAKSIHSPTIFDLANL